MKKLFEPTEEEKEIWQHEVFMLTGMHMLKETPVSLEVTYHIVQKLFLTVMMIIFGPVLLSLILFGIFDLSTAPIWVEVIAYLISGLFTLGAFSKGIKLYAHPTKLVLDKEFKRIILLNPDQKNYNDGKPWPNEITTKDIRSFKVYKRRDIESRKDNFTLILNLNDEEKILIFSSQNATKFEQVKDYLNLYLGIKETVMT